MLHINSFQPETSAIPAVKPPFPDHRHLNFFSPQLPVPDIEMIAGISPGEVIIVEGGKLCGGHPSRAMTMVMKRSKSFCSSYLIRARARFSQAD